jgi:hypothetical protein
MKAYRNFEAMSSTPKHRLTNVKEWGGSRKPVLVTLLVRTDFALAALTLQHEDVGHHSLSRFKKDRAMYSAAMLGASTS